MKMGTLLRCLMVLFLAGCGGAVVIETTTDEEGNEKKTLKVDLEAVQDQLTAFAEEHDLDTEEAVTKAQAMLEDATARYEKAREDHPELEEFFSKGEDLFRKALERKGEGDESGFEALIAQYKEVREDLEERTKEMPELQYLAEQLVIAEEAAEIALEDAAETVSEGGKTMAEEFQELRKDIEDLFDKLD